jgi:hypothetical protein
MKAGGFKIRRITAKEHGIKYQTFQLIGYLDGHRVRKRFKSREDALGEQNRLSVQAANSDGAICARNTRLTAEQLAEAEVAFRRLAGKPYSLAFCADYVTANYRAPEREKLLVDAVADYLAVKELEQRRAIISAIQVGSIKKELTLLTGRFPKQTISTLVIDELSAFCERGHPSLKTFNNRRGILSTLFKFAFQKNWIVSNLIEKIHLHRRHRDSVVSSIVVTQAPPAMQQEVVLAQPSSQHVWIAGYCTWRNDRYEWMAGHWEQPPSSGAVWNAPRWEQHGNAYKFSEGYWN